GEFSRVSIFSRVSRSLFFPHLVEIEMGIDKQDEREYPHWNRVYMTVIIYTIALIIGLWTFSKAIQ
ncbi:MAG: hypothetical protein L0226_14130, partial [Acidobacteria bacterium]|nr:hypothetical protein [Acidobacteriota bacterium]